MRIGRRTVVALAVSVAFPFGSIAQACIPSNSAVLLMLDASYSMLRLVQGGATRFAAARAAVSAAVDLFPDEGLIALRIYGSKSQVVRDDCTDSYLAVPFASGQANRSAIKATLADTHARGVTPIAYSLQQAIGDFTSNRIQRTIILVTDGGESCDGDPCTVAKGMSAGGFVINVIGIMTNAVQRASLRCITGATGGTYFDVPVAAQLKDTLTSALQECPVALLSPRRLDSEPPVG
jgi:Ca-activated chloride channel family protein